MVIGESKLKKYKAIWIYETTISNVHSKFNQIVFYSMNRFQKTYSIISTDFSIKIIFHLDSLFKKKKKKSKPSRNSGENSFLFIALH